MKQAIIAAVAVGLCVAGAAGAQETSRPSAAEIIAARQAAFQMSGATYGGMKPVIDSGGSVKVLAFGTGGLKKWSSALPSMFPAGTGPEAGVPTKAKAEIWTNRADFEAKAAAYQAAAARLHELAQADDAAGFAAQWAAVRQTCQACHDAYRSQ